MPHDATLIPGSVEDAAAAISADAVAPAVPRTPANAHQRLDRSMVRGIAWVGGARWLTQLITVGTTIVVGHLLRPEDYGLVAMAGVFFGLVSLLSESAIGLTIVTYRDLTPAQLRQFNGAALLVSAAATVLGMLCAYPLSVAYRTPALVPVVIVGSLGFLISGLRSVPVALLQRDLRFRRVAAIDISQALVQAAATLALAALGAGYWALNAGPLVGSLAATLIAVTALPVALGRPRREDLSGITGFARDVVFGRVAWYLSQNSDFFVAGRRLGEKALGAYTYAWILASMPVDRVTAVLSSVTSAVFSAAQQDMAALRRYLRALTEGVAMLTLPLGIGLALVAEDLVPTVLGAHWEPLIAPLRLLAIYAPVRAVTPLASQVLYVTPGGARANLRVNLLSLLLLPAAFYVGSQWGTVGIAAMWLSVHPLVAGFTVFQTMRGIQMRAREYAGALLPSFVASAVMAATVLASQWMLGAPGWTRLGVGILVGMLTYAAVLWFGFQGRVLALLRFLRSVRR